ncbi:hypothetical protein [Streptomyces sp. OE57]|uniref:hypothetical protein n=1 Tax=Streptomyces lacaronensis TaxID=3379885 RepID=UPI0039B782F8
MPGAVADQCAVVEQADRLLVGGLVLGHQGPRIGLDAKTPRLPARLRALLEEREGRGGDLGLAAPHGRLDQLGQGKARRADGAVLDRLLRRFQRGRGPAPAAGSATDSPTAARPVNGYGS